MHHHGWLHYVVDAMRFIHDSGPWGWAMFIGLYALCCVLLFPASPLTIASGAVYGFFGGTALVLTGNGLGALLCLLITRYFLRDWVARKIAENPRMRAVEKALKHHDWKLVFLTRLSPVMPYSLINYSLGVTSIPAWRFLLATALGSVPATLVYVYIGTLIGNLARLGPEMRHHRPLEYVVQGVGLVIAIGVTIYVTRLASRALKSHLHD